MNTKKIFSLLSIIIFLIGFTACSSDDGDSNPTGNNEPATYSISGSVTDQDGDGVAGYTVTLSGAKAATATTSSSGAYSFADLEEGKTYTVTVDNQSYTVESISSDETYNFQVVVSKSVKISGTVTDLNDNPVAGVPLSFVDSELSSGTEQTTSTDANGNYEFTGELTPGRIWVVRTKSDEHRYGGYSDDGDVAGLDGRGADEAAGSYRTTDVVVNFKQIEDLRTTWAADLSGVSVNAQNNGGVSATLSLHEELISCNWFVRDGSGNITPYLVNSNFTITKSSSGNIHSVTLGSGNSTYEGIYEITKSGGVWTLKFEVVNTADGNTAPTVAGGFGSSNNGADGNDYVWTFTFTK